MTTEQFFLPEPLGQISRAQFQRALDEFSLGVLEDVTPTSTGNFNQNVFLHTSEGEFVFRGAPHYPWQFPKEQHFAELIQKSTSIRGPWPYRLLKNTDVFGWPFVIMPRLPGIELDSLDSAEERSESTWIKVANAQVASLAELQSVTFDFAGDFNSLTNTIRPFSSRYSDWVMAQIEYRWCRSSSITRDDSRWILTKARAWHRQMSTAHKENVIVHGDFGYWNMLFEQSDDALRVSGLYDLMTAMIGDGVADLPRQYTKFVDYSPPAAIQFLDTWKRQTPIGVDSFDARFHLYLLHERMEVRDFAWRRELDWIDWNIPFQDWMTSYFIPAVEGDSEWHHWA